MNEVAQERDPVIVSVYTPRAFIEAGKRLMQKKYREQQEHARIQRELREAQSACAALFSAG